MHLALKKHQKKKEDDLKYRYLKKCELIKKGDEWSFSAGWWCPSVNIGDKVPDFVHGTIPVVYRRPLKSKKLKPKSKS